MKPFNIEEARAGKPVVTRDGRPARIICFNKKGKQPLVVLTDEQEQGLCTFHCDGRFLLDPREGTHTLDLFMASTKKTYYVVTWTDEHSSFFTDWHPHKANANGFVETLRFNHCTNIQITPIEVEV